ncbi:MAG TPA: hypothetical protein V6D22_18070 [Candidatus Obscuribacterales bacterium]
MKNIGIIVLFVGSVIAVALGVINGTPEPVNLFGAQMSLPEGAVIIGGYIFGVLCTFGMLAGRYSAKAASNQTLQEWEAQDQKMLGQVQSDREKQLEAKIATLEAALQKALKR